MSVGAICFTSSGSNGGCWMVLVFPPPPFFLSFFLFFFFLRKKGFFFPVRKLRQKKKFTRLTPKNFPLKNAIYAYFHNQATLSSSCMNRIVSK